MADYYDIQEVANKLRKTPEEVEQLVKDGQLHQYMDSGKAVFKVDEVDQLTEEIVGLDISSVGSESGGSDMDIQLEETSEIELEPDDKGTPEGGGPDDLELNIEPDMPGQKESEGGFGLSQMGDLTMADTNVGTVGINILSGTGDAYKLTEDTKAETQAADIDELESLDADSNLESFGSGSGLLDLSLQADDTSLGAVLDDILPTADEAGAANLPADEGVGLMDETEDLLAGGEPAPEAPSGVAAPMAESIAPSASPAQMVAVAPVDSKTTAFGIMMFLPMLAMILAAIVLTAAIQNVVPALVKPLFDMEIADTVSLIWVVVGGLVALLLLILLFAAMSGGGTKARKEKKPKKEKKARKKRK